MPAPLRFSAAMRLSGQRAFARVFAARQTAGNGVIVVHAAARPDQDERRAGVPEIRLGLSVSRRIGSAVERHHWKRCLREAFRLQQHHLPSGFDYVVVVRQRLPPSVAELMEMLQGLCERARRPRRPQRPRPPRKGAT